METDFVGPLHRSRVQELELISERQQSALDAAEHERTSLKLELQDLEAKLSVAEKENKMLVDRWMEQKMKDAERLNEVILVSLSKQD